MKICFFSDIHGNGGAFKGFLDKLKDINADIIIFGGDVFGYYYDGVEILEWIADNSNIQCIMGNHERMVIDAFYDDLLRKEMIRKYGASYLYLWDEIKEEHIEIIKNWRPFISLEYEDKRYGFFHGGPNDYLNERIYPDIKFDERCGYFDYTHIISGHTHHKMDKMINGCRFINGGSVGQQRDGKGCSFVILDTEFDRVFFSTIDYDVEILARQIESMESDDNMRNRLIEVLYRKETM